MTARDAGRDRPWLLAIDTATSQVVVAAGTEAGEPITSRAVPAEHRHGERLLITIDALIADAGLDLPALRGVVVGTGPGAFTGLRVGLATAKTLAHELGIPIAGISTGAALLAAVAAAGIAGDGVVLRLPAGPHDRVEIRPGERPHLVPGGPAANASAESGSDLAVDRSVDRAGDGAVPELAIAIDLPGRATRAELERGAMALAGLPASLLRLGLVRLSAGSDDPATLVPEYVMLPRGAAAGLDVGKGVSWSHDRP